MLRAAPLKKGEFASSSWWLLNYSVIFDFPRPTAKKTQGTVDSLEVNVVQMGPYGTLLYESLLTDSNA